MPYRGLCVMRCAPLEIVVPRQEEISGAATASDIQKDFWALSFIWLEQS